ncbi:unnamed protein product [Dimorphilus gyrociliatus]|uniref:Neurotransmitter-gated ion-channel ligand-binding domain-containing protein n=1 Tax=Dimorphilus gyrociliatus TaxID=2664684 RepID=A0A7I8VK47_9ANNE|nr:unnamed protein product [Dimorphilus gyrociliatus]
MISNLKILLAVLLLSLVEGVRQKSCPDGVRGTHFTLKKIFGRLERYGRFIRPTTNESAPIEVGYQLTPIYISALNTGNNIVTLHVWETRKWVNSFMKWRNFCSVSLRVPVKRMWIPDVVVANEYRIII